MPQSSTHSDSSSRQTSWQHTLFADFKSLGYSDELADQWVADAMTVGVEPAQGEPWWFDLQAVDDLLTKLVFSEHAKAVLLAMAKRIRTSSPVWATYARVVGACYVHADRTLRARVLKRPAPPAEKWQELARLHRAAAYLDLLPVMVQGHAKLGIPLQVTIDTARDISDRVDIHQKMHRCVGMHDEGWLANHIRLELFALGRLQFAPSHLVSRLLVLGNDQNETRIMLLDGLAMRGDGLYANADDQKPENARDPWTTTFEQTSTHWQGHLLDDMGQAMRQPTRLEKSQWRCLLEPGDTTLAIHIPEGKPLATDACLASIEQARTFFPKHLNFSFKAVTCVSWLMDPQFTQVLPAKSNLAGFVRLFLPYPVTNANDSQMFERVFGGPVKDLASAPRDTSLRATILDEMARGRRWRTAGGIRIVQSESASR